MQSKATTPDDYIKELPEDRQKAIAKRILSFSLLKYWLQKNR